jgi:hypothetical protein
VRLSHKSKQRNILAGVGRFFQEDIYGAFGRAHHEREAIFAKFVLQNLARGKVFPSWREKDIA